jgi:hypothetical protein
VNINVVKELFDFDVLDSFDTEKDAGNEVRNGLLICRKNQKDFIVPVIDDIMIWINSDFIVDNYQLTRLKDTIDSALEYGFHSQLCNDYKKTLTKRKDNIQVNEIRFYENKYKKRYSALTDSFREYGDYLLSAQKEILRYLPDAFAANKTVLEISGGDFYCLHATYPYSSYNYKLIGTEISFWGLKCGKKLFPDSIMIQASLDDNIYFKSESVDLLFIKGVLHHALLKENSLFKLIPAIKPNGYIGIQEVVLDNIRKSGTLKFLKSIIEPENKTSPLNESISKKNFLIIYYKHFSPINFLEHGSVIKFMLNTIFRKQKSKNRTLSKFIHYSDIFANKIPLIGRMWLTSTHLISTAGRKKHGV